MSIHRKDGEFLQDVAAFYYKDRGVLRTITEGWYKAGDELRKFWGERQLRRATAPISMYLNAPREMCVQDTVDITAVVVGGWYDVLTYTWTILSGGGVITGSGNVVNFQAPFIPATVVIQSTVTAQGTGTLATQGTSETLTATAQIRVLLLDCLLPDADAPEYNLVADGELYTDLTQQINAVLRSGGYYDTIEYVWEIIEGPGTITRNIHGNTATYTAPHVLLGTYVTLRLTVTVHGTGTQARDGTTDTSIVEERFFVEFAY